MNKNIFVILGVMLIFVSGLAIVAAQNDSESNDTNSVIMAANNSGNQSAPFNYGRCVVDSAKAQKVCYVASKDVRKTCIAGTNETAVKKQCKTTYNSDLKACKTAYKNAKGVCKDSLKQYRAQKAAEKAEKREQGRNRSR